MGRIFLVFMFFLVHQAISQTESPSIALAAEKFQRHYNRDAYDSLYHAFSSQMQQHLPKDETHAFFGRLHVQAGKILKREAVQSSANQVIYKTTFERGVYALELSLDQEGKVSGFIIKPYQDDEFPMLERNISPLTLPFKGAWTVVWGGDTKELNYHVENGAQKNAFDFVIHGENGKMYQTDGRSNDDYYAFGQEILAPCEGEIVLVVDGIKDNRPGEMNPVFIPGNTVVLKTTANEYFVFAHFQQYSIRVSQGDEVKQGDILGHCGNSGNSSEPHLHFHLQNVEEMYKATGAKTHFERIFVNGELKMDYSPVKGEVIQPVAN
jgi:murein DD-endopeptidase MepM/ murein hydrolase activator NlpD